jgi:recombination protein RecR
MDPNKYLPEAVSALIEELNKLPTIGRKSAQRLAFYLIRKNDADIDNLSGAISGIKNKVLFCKNCFNLTENELCKICSSSSRNQKSICVVEEVLDLIAIENTMEFNGVYHVLHGALSPLDGVGPDSLKMTELFGRIEESEEKDEIEVILATSTNTEGEATALYIHEHLKGTGCKISRIASGLPVGGDLDYADEVTLKRAMRGRGQF